MSDRSSSIKIIHIITSLFQGGAESALAKLVLYTQDNVENVVISLQGLGDYGELLMTNGIKVYHLDMPKGSLNPRKLVELYVLLRRETPDIIQTWLYHADLVGGVVGRLSGCKNIVWGVLSYDITARLIGMKTRAVIQLCALLSHFVPSRIVYCAKASIKKHTDIGYSKRKNDVICLGFDQAKIVAELKHPRYDFLSIGCVARWDPQKDHKNLLSALKLLDDQAVRYQCSLVGPGMVQSNENLLKIVDETGVDKKKIRFEGKVDNVFSAMKSFDVHVLPSIGEAFPNVLAEAMLCEVPCISTDVGDAKEIVGDTGWIVPHSAPDRLADAILLASFETQKPDVWTERKAKARRRIEDNFGIEKMIDSYRDLWCKIIDGFYQ